MAISLHKATDNTDLLGYLPDVGNVHLAHSQVGEKIKNKLIQSFLQSRNEQDKDIHQHNWEVLKIVGGIFHKLLHPEMYSYGTILSNYNLSWTEIETLKSFSNTDISDCLKDLSYVEQSTIEPYIIRDTWIIRLNIDRIEQRQNVSSDNIDLLKQAYEKYKRDNGQLDVTSSNNNSSNSNSSNSNSSNSNSSNNNSSNNNSSNSLPIQFRLDAMKNKYPSWPNKDKVDKIKITTDGKVEMMGRKFSVLQPKDGKEDIKNGIVRGYASQWMWDMWYFSGKAAGAECARQGNGMKLFENKEEVWTFIDSFPGYSEKEKIFNFASLFFGNEPSGKPKKPGYWDPDNESWFSVGSSCFAMLSKVDEFGKVYAAYWNDGGIANMKWSGQSTPVVASEDC